MGQGLSCREQEETELFSAVQNGELQIVEAMADEDPNLLALKTLHRRLSALHVAAANGRIEADEEDEMCCICFEEACKVEVQSCGHQMCAYCILALCCHSKPNSSSNNAKIPVCPFCRSSIARLVVAKSKTDEETESELNPTKPRKSRLSVSLGECSSNFKGLSALGSFGRLSRNSGKVAADCDLDFDKS
ncbi:Putative E3 ubiquitin-protein ligase XBAT31 [Striga hermonthica]|uniref:RING-type E3 ubiquitin transferase n=1 Tax=Striga hermonthica TaxID=68872 RepID=A0A9N7NEV9_STRHE|nr:Putative E3 ubiquitin-protein ligase XBAT31 [Striga hermonthica]